MLIKGRNSTPALFGIDFGSSTIKGMLLTKQGEGYSVEAIASEAMPEGAWVDHQIGAPDDIVAALERLRGKLPGKIRRVATAVSGNQVITKVIQLDNGLSELELESQVELEAEKNIPFPIDEISLDFEVLGENPNDSRRDDVLLSAARSEMVNTLAEVLSEAHFQAQVVDVQSHALGRAWQFQLSYQQDPLAQEGVVALIDIGERTMNFAVLTKGEVIYNREQNFGGEQFALQAAPLAQMKPDEANQAWQTLTLSEEVLQMAYPQYVQSLAQQIKRQLSLFISSSGYKNVDAIAISGGVSLDGEIVTQLKGELDLPLIVACPFECMPLSASIQGRNMYLEEGAKYMTALGLALRSFDHV
ncbi:MULTISPECIES: type IV pilus assembly protein PilM [Aliagarivorans]|uniref:type IV pilus assembly protein PilM n=1 Tax=Aliagarivorans TaxID=882379 RepID=UPI0003F6A490|nr:MULTISPECIES: type IV pilus assembly protein PilM [Aliagarivorans]